jgi:hypothetical protein
VKLDLPSLKGQLLMRRFEYVRQHHGEEAVRRVLERLPAADRALLATVNRDGWYPAGSLVQLDHAIAETLAGGDPAIFERLGVASARQRTERLQEHAPLISVHGFLSLVADEHRRFQNFGRAAYRKCCFTAGEIAFSEYPVIDESVCLATRGYLRGAVEALTGVPAVVDETACQRRGDPACVFAVRWAPRGEVA